MRKILFITSRNVLTSCGELRLIKNRAESLYRQYGIGTDVIAFGSAERVDSQKRENIDAGGTMKVISVNSTFQIPLVTGKALDLFTEMNKDNSYEAVVLSGVGTAKLAKRLSSIYKGKIILDVHGSSEDTLELSRIGSIGSRIKFRTIFLLRQARI